MGFDAGAFLGSAAGALIGADAQADANAANRAMAWQQMEWQERMRNSAHVKEAADLKAAGLNRMLTMKGAGAPMPSVPSPGDAQPVIEPSSIQRIVSTALDQLRLNNEVKGLNSQIGLQTAQAAAATATAMKDVATAKQTELSSKALDAQLEAIRLESKNREGQAKWERRFMEFDNVMRRLQNGLDTAASGKDLATPIRLPTPKNKPELPPQKPKMDTRSIGLP